MLKYRITLRILIRNRLLFFVFIILSATSIGQTTKLGERISFGLHAELQKSNKIISLRILTANRFLLNEWCSSNTFQFKLIKELSEKGAVFEVEILRSKVMDLANLPFVVYLDRPSKPKQIETPLFGHDLSLNKVSLLQS